MWKLKRTVGRSPGSHPYSPENMKPVKTYYNKQINMAAIVRKGIFGIFQNPKPKC